MTHISRKKINKKVLNTILDFLVTSLTMIRDEKEMRIFLDSFFSSTEKIMLAKRLGVAFLLKEKVSQEKISETLSIGRPTVQRMKLWLEVQGDGYKIAVDIIKKSQKIDEFKQVLSSILNKMAKPYQGFLSGPNVT